MTEHQPAWWGEEGEAGRMPGIGDDPFVTYDAAYVLGALSSEDRDAFEEHLLGCQACSHAVLELAGMPGLLAQGRSDPGWGEHAPESLLPSLAGKVRRSRLWRRVGIVGTIAATGFALLILTFSGESRQLIVEEGTRMTALRPIPVQARASLTGMSNGTRVDMSCSYGGGREGGYLLVAVRKDGSEKTLATWNAIPENTARMSIGTTLPRADIDALEIRLPDNTPILRLTP